MKRSKKPWTLMSGVLISGMILAMPAAAQVTWYVDDATDPAEDGSAAHPFDAIQEAIDASVNGDKVVVLDGTYAGSGNCNLNFGGRLITVRSLNGPRTCIIDCENVARGFVLTSGETDQSVVRGFTIVRGRADDGAGMQIVNSGPNGPMIIDCVFLQNTATNNGAGIWMHTANASVISCRFVQNLATDGGGIYCSAGSLFLANSVLRDNVVTGSGTNLGGGMSIVNSAVVELVNCTIGFNSTEDLGGGVYIGESGSATLTNCVLWENDDQNGMGESSQIRVTGGTAVVTYSCVQGLSTLAGAGNIGLDPIFDDIDLRLAPDSPCIDAADSTALQGIYVDIDGKGRLLDVPSVADTGISIGVIPVTADMGAYEFVLPGDADWDWDVDLTDLSVLLSTYGISL